MTPRYMRAELGAIEPVGSHRERIVAKMMSISSFPSVMRSDVDVKKCWVLTDGLSAKVVRGET